jgi:ribonuclease T1
MKTHRRWSSPFVAALAVLLAGPLMAAPAAAPSPALGQLLASAPASARDSAASVAAPAAAPASVSGPSALAIPPGTALTPEISDPGRVRLILQIVSDVYYGNPLRFPKDGVVWQNREGLLPAEPLGFYHEYTVLPPPGSPSVITIGGRTVTVPPSRGTRGAERLIIGGGRLLYYTADHYRSFTQLTVVP